MLPQLLVKRTAGSVDTRNGDAESRLVVLDLYKVGKVSNFLV